MTNAFLDSSARLRQALERRRQKAASDDSLHRIPFVLDQDLSDAVERIGRQHRAAEDYLLSLRDDLAESEAAGEDRDVRASGHDMSDLGQKIANAEAEVERLHAELTAVTAEAREAVVQLVFRRTDAETYERLLIKAGGAIVDTDVGAANRLHDLLLEACFVRIEHDGEDTGITWREFARDAGMSIGELDPIRVLVYSMNRRGANTVPF